MVLRAQNSEFVTSEARQGVTRPHHAAQPVGYCTEDLIAHVVSEAVVDELEAVEIEEHDHHLTPISRGKVERILEAVHEQFTIGEGGEWIVDSRLGKSLPQRSALGDVLDLNDEIQWILRVVAHARHIERRPYVVAFSMDVALFDSVAL